MSGLEQATTAAREFGAEWEANDRDPDLASDSRSDLAEMLGFDTWRAVPSAVRWQLMNAFHEGVQAEREARQ